MWIAFFDRIENWSNAQPAKVAPFAGGNESTFRKKRDTRLFPN
jgi:hypothetical protein